MTVPPPPAVPGESRVNALAAEIRRIDGNHDLGAGALAEALLPFVGDIVEAARRDALTAAARQIEALGARRKDDNRLRGLTTVEHALRIVTDLRDRTAPPHTLSATETDRQSENAPAPVRDAEGPQIAAEGFATMRPYWHGSQPGGVA